MERKWWTLAAVCTGVFMLLLDVTIVNVALPDIQHAFGASLSDLQWVIDAYALTLAALLLTAGRWPTSSAGGSCSRWGSACSPPGRYCAASPRTPPSWPSRAPSRAS